MLKRGILLIPILGICLETIEDAHAQGKNDLQFWNSEGIEIQLSRRWKTGVREELRFKINDGSLYHYFTEIELKYILNKYVEFSMDYRHVSWKRQDHWRLEYRPHINGTIMWNWRDFAFKDRSRLEFRKWEDGDHSWQYRNKLSINFPFWRTRLGIQPYIADEMFFNFQRKMINRNRIYIGCKLTIFKILNGEIYYLWQSTNHTVWLDIHVLGTTFKILL